MEIVVLKCNPNGGQCEKFLSHAHTDFCPHISYNLVLGDTFAKLTVPSLRCPIKKGIYQSSNMMINMTCFDLYPFEMRHKWIVKLNFCERDDEKVQVGCFFAQITRTIIKKRQIRRGNGK